MTRPSTQSPSAETSRDAWIALRDKLRGEPNLVIIFGSEIRGTDIASLVKFGSGIPGAKFVCLGDYANSRGAADMGLYPDLLPGYQRVSDAGKFHEEWGGVPQAPGLTLPEMVESAKAGKLKAFYVVGANPVEQFGIDPFAFSNSFVVVQDMFLTETAVIADVVLPAANAYEKSGTFTNTCGDLQLVKKAGEVTRHEVRFRNDCPHRRRDGLRRSQVGAVWPGNRRGHGAIARRAIRRSRPARGVAGGQRTRTEDEPVRSHGDSG